MAKKENIVAAIKAHLRRPKRVLLSAHQQEMWKRIDHAWALLIDTKNVKTDVEKVDVLCYTHKVSTNMGYLYMAYAKELYGDIQEGNKSANRAIIYAYAVEAFKMAQQTRNAAAMAAAVGQMVKILGLDREEPDTPDFSNIQPPKIVAELPPEAQKHILILVQAGVVDLNKKIPIEDAEIITDESPTSTGKLPQAG